MKKQWEESEKRRETRENIREKRKEPENRRCRRAKKVAKSRNVVFFQWFVAPAGWKLGSPKWRTRSHLARWDMTSCTLLWREAFSKIMYKIHYARTTFGSCDVEKARTVVVGSTSRMQNVQHSRAGPLYDVAMSKNCTPLRHAAHVEVKNGKLPGTEHFCKSWCRKSARRCGAKHMSKSKCTKRPSVGPLLEVATSKKCIYSLFRHISPIFLSCASKELSMVSIRFLFLYVFEFLIFPESACEGFFVKRSCYTTTSSHLHICWSTSSHLHICWSTSSHLYICRSTSSHLHTCRSRSSHIHTCRSRSSHPHICWSTSSHLHTCWSTSSHPHTCRSTSSHLHICWSTSSHPHICRSTSSHFHICWSTSLHPHTCRSTSSHPHICRSRSSHPHTGRSRSSHPHICRSTSSHPHTCRSTSSHFTSADLHLHTFTPADPHLHTLTSADLHLHTFTSADLLSLFFYSLLRRGRCRRSATKRNPFARNGRWTSKT